jgi:hypothetical protein
VEVPEPWTARKRAVQAVDWQEREQSSLQDLVWDLRMLVVPEITTGLTTPAVAAAVRCQQAQLLLQVREAKAALVSSPT